MKPDFETVFPKRKFSCWVGSVVDIMPEFKEQIIQENFKLNSFKDYVQGILGYDITDADRDALINTPVDNQIPSYLFLGNLTSTLNDEIVVVNDLNESDLEHVKNEILLKIDENTPYNKYYNLKTNKKLHEIIKNSEGSFVISKKDKKRLHRFSYGAIDKSAYKDLIAKLCGNNEALADSYIDWNMENSEIFKKKRNLFPLVGLYFEDKGIGFLKVHQDKSLMFSEGIVGCDNIYISGNIYSEDNMRNFLKLHEGLFEPKEVKKFLDALNYVNEKGGVTNPRGLDEYVKSL